MTKRGLLWDYSAPRAGVREIDMWSKSWAESYVVNGRVLGSLHITQQEVCELNLLYIALSGSVYVSGSCRSGRVFDIINVGKV